MLFSYLKITLRNIKKQWFYATLNITGLAIGISSTMLIAMYVIKEFSYDKFYADYNNIYRINTVWKNQAGEQRYATTPPPLHQAIIEEIPDIDFVTCVFKWSDFTLRADHHPENVYRETNAWFANQDFFKVLNFGLLEGDPETVLSEPYSMVLPKATAVKYFGRKAFDNNQILGRSLFGGNDGGSPWKITGIMEDQPPNSHFQFDLLISAITTGQEIVDSDNWSWNIMHTYVLLDKHTDKGALRKNGLKKKLNKIVEKYALPNMGYQSFEAYRQEGGTMEYVLQPISDIHLTSDYLREMRPNGNLNYVYAFIAIGLFIVVMVAVNFVNLSTAQSSNRSREVGVKKVLGGNRLSLINQFLLESIAFAFAGLIIAMGLAELFLKFFPEVLDINLSYQSHTWTFWFFLVGGTLLLGILAGAYPAFYLSSFRPVKVLNGKPGAGVKGKNLRNVLITFQLVISVSMIICTLIAIKQVGYIRNKSLGFHKENVIIIQNDREIDERRESFKDYLLTKPGVKSVGFSTGIPGLKNFHMRDFVLPGQNNGKGIRWYEGDDDYLSTLNIELKEGRSFNWQRASDSGAVILNEAAVKAMGLTNPLGRFLIKNAGAPDEQKVHIIGVMKDFNFESFHHKIQPLVIEFLDNYVFKDYISIRISGDNPQEALETIEAAWKVFEPNVPFNYSFLDEDFDQLFKSEIKLQQVFGIFTFLAIFIAGLGLIGLAAFIAESRKKEIGVRKVFGAGLSQILLLLSKSFAAMTTLSIFIASPLAYIMMSSWLQSFEYKTSISIDVFFLGGLLMIFIVSLTVGYQSVKTALVNPVTSLKEE